MWSVIGKIGKALRGLRVRARKVTRTAGRIMRKSAPEEARITLRARAAKLLRGVKKAVFGSEVRNILKKFRAAKTLEAKLKVADKAYFKKQPELALKLYNRIAAEALKNPGKYFSMAVDLKRRAAELKQKLKTPYLKKQCDILLHRAEHLMGFLETANETGAPGSYRANLKTLINKFEKISPKKRAASIEKEFNKTSDPEIRFSIIDIVWDHFKNYELAAKLYERSIEKLLKTDTTGKLCDGVDRLFRPKESLAYKYKTKKLWPKSTEIAELYYRLFYITEKTIIEEKSSSTLMFYMQKKLARARQLITDTKYKPLIDYVNTYLKNYWGVSPEEINALIHTQL